MITFSWWFIFSFCDLLCTLYKTEWFLGHLLFFWRFRINLFFLYWLWLIWNNRLFDWRRDNLRSWCRCFGNWLALCMRILMEYAIGVSEFYWIVAS